MAALWKNEILIFLFANTLFVTLFNILSTDHNSSYSHRFVRPKPFFDHTHRHLINFNGFKYVIDNDVCKSCFNCTPILVHSYVGHFEFRRAIRRSYPQTVLDALGFRYVFMTGLPNSTDIQSQLLGESSRHGDIVQGNFKEAYRNLTYKHVMGLKWYAERCLKSNRVVKMDDDIAVNLFKLKDVVERRDYDLAGCVINAKPIREKHNKWYVTREEFDGDTYPPFLSGWLYVATSTSVTSLLRVIRQDNYFWIDDLYVTGILAKIAQIDLLDLRLDFEVDPGSIYCCIKKQQRCEFLAAPTGDNYTLLQQYSQQLTYCKMKNLPCDTYRKSKRHHSCLDLWKKSIVDTRIGKPSIEIINLI
ncbi:Glycosyl transferase, family 31 [Cinara cedri]|uniref:Hexosyltransferase n=1 Tax=Cinara cedri TaxID=506608 RepID=A0A5E4MJS0_9HEMI|nr:Glycosyl transferase, family 31 [Cinara cedri]